MKGCRDGIFPYTNYADLGGGGVPNPFTLLDDSTQEL